MFYIIIACIVAIITFLMGYVAYGYPFYYRDGKKTVASKVYLVLTVVAIIGSFFLGYKAYLDEKDTKTSNKKYENALIELNKKVDACDTVKINMELAMAKIGFQYNETKEELISIKNKKIKFPKQKNEPVLDIEDYVLENSANPYFTISGNDMRFVVTVSPVGSTVARIRGKQTIFIGQLRGEPLVWKRFYSEGPKTELVYKGKQMQFIEHITLPKIFTDPFFIAIEIVYTNEDMSIKKTIRKLYSLTIADQSKHLSQVDNEKFNEIEVFLRKNKVWK